jgi:hypothetical protein
MTEKRAGAGTKSRQQRAERVTAKGTMPTTAITLTAQVPRDWQRRADPISQRDLAFILGVDVRTIANYAKRGMPVAIEKPRPQYRYADCTAWTAYFRHFVEEFQRHNRTATPPHYLPFRDALNWLLQREATLQDEGNEYVVVPLRHDHPRRAALLQEAAAGLPPLPLLYPEELDGDDGDDDDTDADR